MTCGVRDQVDPRFHRSHIRESDNDGNARATCHMTVLRLSGPRHKYLAGPLETAPGEELGASAQTRAGLEAKSCGKLRPVGACPARRGHYGARPTMSRESSCNLRTLYSRIHRVHRRMLAVDSKSRNTQAAARRGPLRRDLVALPL